MNAAWIVAALLTGVVLGVVHFGGLWLTVRRLSTAQSPALLFLVSFLVRTAVVVAGFYLIMNGRWEPALACVAGFLLARTLVCRRVRREEPSNDAETSLSERAAS